MDSWIPLSGWCDSPDVYPSGSFVMNSIVCACFCEALPNQGGVRHMEVVRFAPGKALVLVGALGPLRSLAVTGSWDAGMKDLRARATTTTPGPYTVTTSTSPASVAP